MQLQCWAHRGRARRRSGRDQQGCHLQGYQHEIQGIARHLHLNGFKQRLAKL